MKQFNSVQVAEYLRYRALKKGKILNITQVQKLLYLLYGYFFKKHDVQILDEFPVAYPFGPVFPRTRTEVKYDTVPNMPEDLALDACLGLVVDEIIDNYGKFPANKLSSWSTSKGGAWDVSVRENRGKWNREISNKHIKEYFSTMRFFDEREKVK